MQSKEDKDLEKYLQADFIAKDKASKNKDKVTNNQVYQGNQLAPPKIYKLPPQMKNAVINIAQNNIHVFQNHGPVGPPVTVNCKQCNFQQYIPAEARQYYCGKCKEINDTQPTFGIFICGICRQKVLYPYKISDRIHCNICHSINIVPRYPPGYQKTEQLSKELKERQQIDNLQGYRESQEITTARLQDKQLEEL